MPPSASAVPLDLETTAVHGLLALLEAEGVECIFGVPGGPLTPLFEALRQRGTIRFVLARHEEGAALMAAAYATVKGGLAVCCATSGPGATNAVTGIASAWTNGLPVLLLSGQVATRDFGRGAIQESTVTGVDLVALFRPITKLSAMASHGQQVPSLAREAIRRALAAPRGPVHLNLPADLLAHRIHAPSSSAGFRVTSVTVDAPGARSAGARLASAHRPCILAGHGVSLAGAHQELRALAEQLSIPVATTAKGKDVFPESHPLSLGVAGFGGHPRADAWLEGGVDVMLVVGSSLGEFATNSWDPRLQGRGTFIQVDHDPTVMGRNYSVDIGVVGDARAALRSILDRLPADRIPRDTDPLSELRQRVPRWEAADLLDSDAVPLTPQRLIRELRAALPDDGMLFVDNGSAIIWAGHYFEARRPRSYFIDLGLAGMGSAVAGVIGGKLAAPERAAVALVGDAAFAMNGMEVHTAVELGLPVTWIVLNNQGHGMVTQGERLMRGADLGYGGFRSRIDAAGIGAALGARAFRIDSAAAFRAALDEALASPGPTVIDALIDGSVVPPTLASRARALSRACGHPPRA